MGLHRLRQMSLLEIKSDILESITNIGGPWGRGMGGSRALPPNFTGSIGGGGHVPPKFLPDTQ